MTTKKKSRPLFEVPAEVESGAHSGWVYRSGAGAEPTLRVETSSRGAGASIAAQSVDTLALALAAMSQVVALGMTIAAIPLTMGLRALRGLAKADETG
jgi:hypothetical protein